MLMNFVCNFWFQWGGRKLHCARGGRDQAVLHRCKIDVLE